MFNKIYLYHKEKNAAQIQEEFPFINVIRLNNVGRESDTYYTHIIKHYDNLTEHIVFIQAHPWHHTTKDDFDKIIRQRPKIQGFSRKYPTHSDDFNIWKYIAGGYKYSYVTNPTLAFADSWKRDITTIMEELWGDDIKNFSFVVGGQFIVSRDRILKYKKSLYKELRKFFNTIGNGPWMMERLWILLFSENNIKLDNQLVQKFMSEN